MRTPLSPRRGPTLARARHKLLALGIALVAASLLLEGLVRLFLFAPWTADTQVAHRIRRPERLAHANEDLYWALQEELSRVPLRPVPNYEARHGWLGNAFAPGEPRLANAPELGGRRAVVLYGDSYAACASPQGTCFQDYLERSELSGTHCLVNLGVAGYGLDQVLLLLESTLDAYAEADPVVAIGILVDDDLDRAALSMRGWPKPRFERDGDGWRLAPAAPARPRPGRSSESYALRLLIHGEPLASSAIHRALCRVDETERENRERCRMLLARIVAEVEQRGLDFFFVLFYGGALAAPELNGWREAFVRETLTELGAPWVSTRGPLLSHARASGREIDAYYLNNGHMTPLGNEVALRAIVDGLAGRFGELAEQQWSPAELAGSLTADQIAEVVLGGKGAFARYEYGCREPYERTEEEKTRLCFHATGKRPTELRYRLDGRVRAFEATAKFTPSAGLGPGQGSVILELSADGETLLERRLERGGEPLDVQVDLTGRQELSIAVDTAGDGARGDWLVLTSPVFR